jgi:hypothetical protein
MQYRNIVIFSILFSILWFGSLFSFKKQALVLIWDNVIDRSLYLQSLKEDRHKACLTLLLSQPEVLFTGDSHGYSGWDHVELQKHMKLKLGACYLPGSNSNEFLYLLHTLKKIELYPKYIVWSISPRMVLKTNELSKKRLTDNREYLDQAMDYDRQLVTMLGMGKKYFNPFFPESGYQKDIFILSEDDIQYSVENAKEILKLAKKDISRVSASWKKEFQNICRTLKTLGSKLILVTIPESKKMNSMYSKEIVSNFKEEFSRLKACESFIETNDLKYQTMSNRFFVNRKGKKIMFDSIKSKKLSKKDFKASSGLFSPDHLNYIGAKIFTKKWINKNNELLKIWSQNE